MSAILSANRPGFLSCGLAGRGAHCQPDTAMHGEFMAKPNYSHQKKQREQAAKKKRDEKLQRRQQKKEDEPSPPEGTPKPE